MELAIIGGGLYGCYIANKLANEKKGIKIDLFDRKKEILNSTASNNQSRLHYGFHYPRSFETIQQTLKGSIAFKEEFPDCIIYPKENYYAIHKNSLIDFEKYLSVIETNNLNYRIVDKKDIPYLRDITSYEGIVNTDEGVIVLSKLKNKLLNGLKNSNINIYCENNVSYIDSKSGKLSFENKVAEKKYDFVINTTYIDPNLGLSKQNNFQVKYELAGMVLMKNTHLNNMCITIMDGDFVSLYMRDINRYTLSSVKYTPFMRFNNLSDFQSYIDKDFSKIELNKYKENIINDAKQYFTDNCFENVENKMWIAPKVKLLNDADDTRVTSLINNEKVISILCGKIDAIPLMYEEILAIIK